MLKFYIIYYILIYYIFWFEELKILYMLIYICTCILYIDRNIKQIIIDKKY